MKYSGTLIIDDCDKIINRNIKLANFQVKKVQLAFVIMITLKGLLFKTLMVFSVVDLNHYI